MVGDPARDPAAADVPAEERAAIRARFGIPPDALMVASFGFIHPDKMSPEALDAFRRWRRPTRRRCSSSRARRPTAARSAGTPRRSGCRTASGSWAGSRPPTSPT